MSSSALKNRMQAALMGLIFLGGLSARGQDAAQPGTIPPPTTTDVVQQPAATDDRWPALRERADNLKAAFAKIHDNNLEAVAALMRTRRCQISRIGGLLDRAREALNAWEEVELKYWDVWDEAEQKRVDGEKNTLASMELEQKRLADLLETGSKEREELLRKKDDLDKFGKKTEEIRKDIDNLVSEIRESDGRLTDVKQQYSSLTEQISTMSASITKQLVVVREYRRQVHIFSEEKAVYYEHQRAAAQEICNSKQPKKGKLPLPKSAAQ